MLVRIIKSYRDIVVICDSDLIGKEFEEGKFQIDIKENFFKGEEKTEQEIKLEEKELELWSKEVAFTLKEEGLDVFADFVKADVNDKDSLKEQITKLKEIVGKLELSNTYQPSNHKPVDAYSIAKKNKDVASMIKNKLNF